MSKIDPQEIRMRCLEVAQAATKTPAIMRPEPMIEWAAKFEAFVVNGLPKPATAPAPENAK